MPTPDGAPAAPPAAPVGEPVDTSPEGRAPGDGVRIEMLGDLQLGWVDLLCVAPILLASAWGLLGSPLAPGLIDTHPVLLAALRGSIPSMIVCGAFAHAGRIPLWQAIAAPVPILVWVDPFYYWAGRRYGRLLLDHYRRQGPRLARRIDRAERFFARFGIWAIAVSAFLPIQPFLFLAAGETRMRFWKFAIADIFSTLAWVCLIVGLGWVFDKQGVRVADTIGHYGLILTIVLVAVVVVVSVRSSLRQSRAA